MLLLTVVRSCEVYTCPIIWGTVLILQAWWIVVTGSQSIPICWKLLVHSPCHQKPPTIKLLRGHILHHPTLETPWHHSYIASVVPRYTQHAHHTTSICALRSTIFPTSPSNDLQPEAFKIVWTYRLEDIALGRFFNHPTFCPCCFRLLMLVVMEVS